MRVVGRFCHLTRCRITCICCVGTATNRITIRFDASCENKFITVGSRDMGLTEAFGWQTGYCAFSVSRSNVSAVAKYIEEQESHHQKRTFQEEFVQLLAKHGIEYDPKFVFG